MRVKEPDTAEISTPTKKDDMVKRPFDQRANMSGSIDKIVESALASDHDQKNVNDSQEQVEMTDLDASVYSANKTVDTVVPHQLANTESVMSVRSKVNLKNANNNLTVEEIAENNDEASKSKSTRGSASQLGVWQQEHLKHQSNMTVTDASLTTMRPNESNHQILKKPMPSKGPRKSLPQEDKNISDQVILVPDGPGSRNSNYARAASQLVDGKNQVGANKNAPAIRIKGDTYFA